MTETDPITPFVVANASCPRCGRVTDICIEQDPPLLYCEQCNHQWINLANVQKVGG